MLKAIESGELSRRRFLLRTGWVMAGLTLVSSCSAMLPALPSTTAPEVDDALFWFQALPNGTIRFFCPRMEMGQGTTLGLCQVVAEELCIDISRIECVKPNTKEIPAFRMTVGSEGISRFFEPVSYGAACLREELRHRAADLKNVPLEQIRLSQTSDPLGGFILPDQTRVTYQELVTGDPIILSQKDTLTHKVASFEKIERNVLKQKKNYTSIGKSFPHPDFETIVTGKQLYSRDIALPDMHFGWVLHPPTLKARIEQVDIKTALMIPDVTKIIVDKEESFVGIITSNPLILSDVAEAIDITWTTPKSRKTSFSSQLNVKNYQAQNDFEHTLINQGNLESANTTAIEHIEATYSTSFMTHAPMEVRAAVAWVQDEKVDIWCGTQDPYFVQSRVAKVVKRSKEKVVVHPLRLGGGFGGRVVCQASEEAARLSAFIGKPVRVAWDRKTEIQNNYFQPPFSHSINARATPQGKISHWKHDFVSSPIITGLVPPSIAWIVDSIKADEGTARGSLPPYIMENQRIRYSDIRTEVPIGAWRGLGAAPNTFAIESMIDELAHKTGVDPFSFRVLNLSKEQTRLIQALKRLKQLSQWNRKPIDVKPKEIAQGRGLACAIYKEETAVAIVANVEINHSVQTIEVTKIWCVQDCGLVINPHQVENQIYSRHPTSW